MRQCLLFLAAATLIAGILMLSGCASRDNELVGIWSWDGDPSYVTTFYEDGTGTQAVDWGFGYTFNWSTSGSTLIWNYPSHSRLRSPYNISGNVLTITLDDGSLLRLIRD